MSAAAAALQQLDDLLITAPEQLRSELRHRRRLKARAALCLQLRPDPTRLHELLQAAKLALRSLARRVRELEPPRSKPAPAVRTATASTTAATAKPTAPST